MHVPSEYWTRRYTYWGNLSTWEEYYRKKNFCNGNRAVKQVFSTVKSTDSIGGVGYVPFFTTM